MTAMEREVIFLIVMVMNGLRAEERGFFVGIGFMERGELDWPARQR